MRHATIVGYLLWWTKRATLWIRRTRMWSQGDAPTLPKLDNSSRRSQPLRCQQEAERSEDGRPLADGNVRVDGLDASLNPFSFFLFEIMAWDMAWQHVVRPAGWGCGSTFLAFSTMQVVLIGAWALCPEPTRS